MYLWFRNTLEYVDYELDKTVMAFQSNISASDLWNPTIFIDNRILVLVKFVSHSVQKMIQTATNILRNGKWQMVCKIVVNLLFSQSY